MAIIQHTMSQPFFKVKGKLNINNQQILVEEMHGPIESGQMQF